MWVLDLVLLGWRKLMAVDVPFLVPDLVLLGWRLHQI